MDITQMEYVASQFTTSNVTLRCIESSQINRFPKKIRKKIDIFIVLTSFDKTKTFGHYLLFARTEKEIMYYDPLGFTLDFYKDEHIKTFLRRHKSRSQISVGMQTQDYSSLTCGLHNLYFSLLLCKYMRLRKAMSKLKQSMTKNYLQNDKRIVKYFYRNFNMPDICIKLFCDENEGSKANCKTVCF